MVATSRASTGSHWRAQGHSGRGEDRRPTRDPESDGLRAPFCRNLTPRRGRAYASRPLGRAAGRFCWPSQAGARRRVLEALVPAKEQWRRVSRQLRRCSVSSDSAANGPAKRCARTAPLPRSRSLPLRSWSSSMAAVTRHRLRLPRSRDLRRRPASGSIRSRPDRCRGGAYVRVTVQRRVSYRSLSARASARLLARCRLVAGAAFLLGFVEADGDRLDDPVERKLCLAGGVQELHG
jgi:hypothetical protein